MVRRPLTFANGGEGVSCFVSRSPSPALRAPSPSIGAKGSTIMITLPSPQRGEVQGERGGGKRFRNCKGIFGTGLLHFAWRSVIQIAVLVICTGPLNAATKTRPPV